MLVTFKTTSHPDITMFGTAAVALLKLMGQSGNVPGAIMPADIPAALEKLEAGLGAIPDESADTHSAPDDADGEDQQAPVSLSTRARPLMDLLQSARDTGDSVVWDD